MSTIRRVILRYADAEPMPHNDMLVEEEPLEIVVDGMPYAVTMRMPGDDEHLALGFLYTEGVIQGAADVASMRCCAGALGQNRLHVDLAARGGRDRPRRKAFVSASSCGLCGKEKLEEALVQVPPVGRGYAVPAEFLLGLDHRLTLRQFVFRVTGATHFAALLDASGSIIAFAEDIGRHNALDKVIGQVLAAGKSRQACLAVVSSRLSFEMVQKAGMLGVQMLAGLSVATGMAVELADRLNMTLIGRLRGASMNVYTHPERVFGAAASGVEVEPQASVCMG